MSVLSNICLIDEYKEIIKKNIKTFENLENICKKTGELVEGNCFTEHLNIDNKIDCLLYKQCNHFSLGKMSNKIMEIGFNAGHSSLLYLLANSESKITIFDICEHKYTMLCFEYLKFLFPGRLKIYEGDSTKTIPEFYKNNPNEKFDLIHIDGCHITDIANADFYNSIKLAGDILIWDDTQIIELNDLFNSYIKQGLIYEIDLYKTYIYEHRICRINPLLNKKYKWGDSKIEFLEDNKMDAFGDGNYEFIDKYLVKCVFGDWEHILKFNEDYSKYTSIRKDNCIINGHLYDLYLDITFNVTITISELLRAYNYEKHITESIDSILYSEKNIKLDYIDFVIDHRNNSEDEILKGYNIVTEICNNLISDNKIIDYNIYVLVYSDKTILPKDIPNHYNLYKDILIKNIGKNILLERDLCFKNNIVYLLSFLLCKTKYYIHLDGNRKIKLINSDKPKTPFIINSINLINKYNQLASICLSKKDQNHYMFENTLLEIPEEKTYIFPTNNICDGVKWEQGDNIYKIEGILDNGSKQPHMTFQTFICDIQRLNTILFTILNKHVDTMLYRKHIETITECMFTESFIPVFIFDNTITRIDERLI